MKFYNWSGLGLHYTNNYMASSKLVLKCDRYLKIVKVKVKVVAVKVEITVRVVVTDTVVVKERVAVKLWGVVKVKVAVTLELNSQFSLQFKLNFNFQWKYYMSIAKLGCVWGCCELRNNCNNEKRRKNWP